MVTTSESSQARLECDTMNRPQGVLSPLKRSLSRLERLFVEQEVTGSNPVSRPRFIHIEPLEALVSSGYSLWNAY